MGTMSEMAMEHAEEVDREYCSYLDSGAEVEEARRGALAPATVVHRGRVYRVEPHPFQEGVWCYAEGSIKGCRVPQAELDGAGDVEGLSLSEHAEREALREQARFAVERASANRNGYDIHGADMNVYSLADNG